jgi:transposase
MLSAACQPEETMQKRYIVTLTDEEGLFLLDLVKKGTLSARKLTRAHMLLRADEGATDDAIAVSLHVARTTVERLRRRFVEGNLEEALEERPRPGAKRKLNRKQEAYLIAITCTPAPEGQARWSMQLLADELVQLGMVDSTSDETVRRTLKKTFSSPGKSKST